MTSNEPLTPNYAEDIYYNYLAKAYQKIAKDDDRRVSDWQRWDTVYRGFRIQRASEDHCHVHILNLDGSPPPVKLRGTFTAWARAEKEVDKYLAIISLAETKNDIERKAL